MAPPKRILIAHGDPEARIELRSVADEQPAVTGTLEASNFDMMIERLRKEPAIDLLIVDLDLPGMFWEVGLRHVLDRQDGLRIAVLLGAADRDKLRSLSNRSMTLLPKHLPMPALARLVGDVIEGMKDDASAAPSRPAFAMRPSDESPAHDAPPPAHASDFPLTLRQTDVLRLLSEGYSNHEIATALAIAEGTVKVHVNAAFRILGVHNRVSAASAFRHYIEERLAQSVGAHVDH